MRFGLAISVLVLSKPRLRTRRVVELWCEEPDRALADTALVKESPNNTARRTPDWHSQSRTQRCSRALGRFAVPAQEQQWCSCTDDGFKPAARAVCSTSTLGDCFTERWMLEMQSPAIVVFTARALLTLLADFPLSLLLKSSLKWGLMHLTKKTSSAEHSNTDGPGLWWESPVCGKFLNSKMTW